MCKAVAMIDGLFNLVENYLYPVFLAALVIIGVSAPFLDDTKEMLQAWIGIF